MQLPLRTLFAPAASFWFRVGSLVCAVAAIALVAACGDTRPTAPDVASAIAPAEGSVSDPLPLARFNGAAISVETYLDYVERVRMVGYRPATELEASRLLRALLAEELLAAKAKELEEGGHPARRIDVLRALALQVTGIEPAHAVEFSLRAQRRLLDDALEREEVEWDRSVLNSLVRDRAAGPPLPPGFSGRKTGA